MEDDIFIRVDIMNKTPQGWDMYEVKSSSSLRSYHKEDAKLAMACFKKSKWPCFK